MTTEIEIIGGPPGKDEVQALATAWSSAFNAGQIDDLVAFYLPDTQVFPPGRPALIGEPAMRSYFLGVRAQGFHDYRVRIDDLLTTRGMVVATGRWGITGPSPEGFERRYEGSWMIGLTETAPGRIAVQMWN